MVGPSHTPDDRTALNRRLLTGVALLIAVSGGLVAVQAGGTGPQVAAAGAVGLGIGVALSWFLARLARQVGERP